MNDRNESIVRTKRTLMIGLTLFPWLARHAYADSQVPTVPPGRSFRWDISRKGSRIEQEFIVTEYRSYHFEIEFHHNGLPSDWERFIGRGGDIFFTKDAVNPRRVNPWEVGGISRLYELYRQGELIIKYADPGVIVPVLLRVEKIDEVTGNRILLLEKTFNTEAMSSGGNGVISRNISGVALKAGRYKVTATTQIDVPLPPAPNAQTFTALGISYYAKVSEHRE